MKHILLLIALTSCKTIYWKQASNVVEPVECEGKAMNPETQECIESEREKRSYGVRK